jgi:Zn-dependent peptidase ImmA (M78 family)
MTVQTKYNNPETVALDIIDQANQFSPPINLEKVLELWPQLEISYDELEEAGYFVDLGNVGGQILIRKKDRKTRQRYTIAHELGHWLLKELNPCSINIGIGKRNEQVEKWCNQFAAALLMPESWVLYDLRKSKLKGLVDCIISIPTLYEVSHEAFRIRVSQLTPINIYEIESSNSSGVDIHQSYESLHFKKSNVSCTLGKILDMIQKKESVIPKEFRDLETGLLALLKSFHMENKKSGWIVCLLDMKT